MLCCVAEKEAVIGKGYRSIWNPLDSEFNMHIKIAQDYLAAILGQPRYTLLAFAETDCFTILELSWQIQQAQKSRHERA